MKVVICGDSFAYPDHEYGPFWVDILSKNFEVINLAKLASSNLLISKQVDTAISLSPDFIIVLFTSCTRGEKKYESTYKGFSYHTAIIDKEVNPLSEKDIEILKEYFMRFFDLELSIYQNKLIIENVLNRLKRSDIPFLFDQGGFEYHRWAESKKEYFKEYEKWKSDINLWDYVEKRNFRPYYHISNYEIHKNIANYYNNKIILNSK